MFVGLLLLHGSKSNASAAGCAPTSGRQDGVDVNHGAGSINFSQVAGAGVKFVIAQATEGNTFTDPDFSTYASGARAAGLTVGAYAIFDPADDATSQANYFLNEYLPNASAGDLVPALDVIDDEPDGMTAAELNTAITTWLDTVQQALGVRPLLYTNKGEWNSDNDGDATFGTDGYPLWVIDLGGGGVPALPTGWSNWAFWQYTDTGTVPGISGSNNTDEDYFNAGFNGGNLCTMTLSGAQLAAPTNTAPPQVTGTPTLGQSLACSQGSWSGYPGSFSYQWLRDGSAIGGAMSPSYSVASADEGHQLACQVTATNGAGGTPAISTQMSVPLPTVTTPPTNTPNTLLTAIPAITRVTKAKLSQKNHTAKFSFKAIGAKTGFQCALVKKPKKHHKQAKPSFSSCHSPKTYKHLKAGKYTFEVRAVNDGKTGTPASKSFKIR